MRRLLQLVFLIALVATVVWQGFTDRRAIQVAEALAVPVEGQNATLRLFLNLSNRGGPDQITAVHSGDAASGDLFTPVGLPTIPLPAGGSAILAADGAHLVLNGVEGALEQGRLIPVTVEFSSGQRESFRARIAAPITPGDAAEAGVFGIGALCRTGEGEPAPTVSASITADGDGWLLRLTTEDFTFTEPIAGLGHVPGYGHAHLYVDGVKLRRLYTPEAWIGALPPGEHVISVMLYTNDHRAYVTGDQAAEVRMTVRQN